LRKKILILGGGGFIGSHLYDRIDQQQHQIQRSIRDAQSAAENTLSGSIDRALLDQCTKPDVIFHVAGGASVAESIRDPQHDFDKTLPAMNALLNKMREDWPDSKLVYLSSAAVYGKNASLQTQADTRLAPMSPYGLHKQMTEQMLQYYASMYQLQVKIVRPFSVYGPRLKKQLFWDVLQKARSGQFTYFGSGMQQRDWLYVDDLADFLLYLSDHGWLQTPQILNAGSGIPTSVRTAIELTLQLAGYARQPEFSLHAKEGDPDDLVAAKQELSSFGCLHQTSLTEGLQQYIQWFNECVL
jgi:UDP-glucose 4-epimerase